MLADARVQLQPSLSVQMQLPWIAHDVMSQLLPSQVSEQLPVPAQLAVQLSVQSMMQLPVFSHTNSHPPPGQLKLQLPVTSQTHGSPAEHVSMMLP